MPPATGFRLSLYLTLGLACATLGYAESTLLPEVGAFAAVVCVALAVLFRLETRVRLLSLRGANVLGLGIALANAGWAAFRVHREYRVLEYPRVGWQILLVTLFGPLVMALIPAKLARRAKHADDYWQLHGVGLAVVGLAAAMGDDGVTFALTAGYAVCATWNLTLFRLARDAGALPPDPADRNAVTNPPPAVPAAARPDPVWRAAVWVVAAGLTAVPLFLLTPRSLAERVNFGSQRIEVGYASEQLIDLNRTGSLESNTEPAFEVLASNDDGTPKEDLDPGQRWRGAVLIEYSNGAWKPRLGVTPPAIRPTTVPAPGRWTPPDLGPGRFRLTFQVPVSLRGQFLADPVRWSPGQPGPVASVDTDPPTPWVQLPDGAFLRPRLPDRGRGAVLRYTQITRTADDPDLGPGFEYRTPPDPEVALRPLLFNPVARVKEYTDDLLARLVADGELPPGAAPHPGPDPDRVKLTPPEEHHEAIARAFRGHLVNTPNLTYTTTLRRVNRNVDPVEDFLFHARTGHCERFATALVMMLRSQGIPAVMVLGFKGCEQTEPGRYVVRQEYAHAWAEAIVSRPGVGPDGRATRVRHWLSLDPEPLGAERDTAAQAGGWVGRSWTWLRAAFSEYVLRYTPEKRDRALAAFAELATGTPVLGGLAVVAAFVSLAVVIRRLRRRPPAVGPPESDPARWFGQLLAVLAAHGFAPGSGQTPREFAESVGDQLRTEPGTAAVAGVPAEWAAAYYEARFGAVPLADARRAELDAHLDVLRRALADRSNTA